MYYNKCLDSKIPIGLSIVIDVIVGIPPQTNLSLSKYRLILRKGFPKHRHKTTTGYRVFHKQICPPQMLEKLNLEV